MIEKMSKRTKKAIINNLEKLIKKYGHDETRLVVNKYFERTREKAKLEKEVQERERELLKLKRKLS